MILKHSLVCFRQETKRDKMLTNLASYLMGYLEPAQALNSAAQRLSAEPQPGVPRRSSCGTPSDSEEEDWLLVDAASMFPSLFSILVV